MEGDPVGAYDVRVDWGAEGLASLLAESDAVVIVDVLSFSTCVDVAAGRGAAVYPFAAGGGAAASFALEIAAQCAKPRGEGRYSLSPGTLAAVQPGERIVLPSPNGAALSLQTGRVPTLTACLRNASSVARAARRIGGRIAVIAAGERWASGAMRPALEDWIGAGAVAASLGVARSEEARAAANAWAAARPRLEAVLLDCVSGRELVERGFRDDVARAAEFDVSRCVPILREGAFVDSAAANGV